VRLARTLRSLRGAGQGVTVAEPSSIPPASTFVIRFWREWSAAGSRWRGRIEHVQSGQHADFVDLEGVLEFVQGLGVMAEDRVSPSQTGHG
jgi:hypothetical protein